MRRFSQPRRFSAMSFSSACLVMFACCCFSAMSSCAQPRYVLGGGFPGRPVAPRIITYGQPRGFFQRGPVIVSPPAVIVPRRNFAPRFGGWGGGWGGGRGRRWGC